MGADTTAYIFVRGILSSDWERGILRDKYLGYQRCPEVYFLSAKTFRIHLFFPLFVVTDPSLHPPRPRAQNLKEGFLKHGSLTVRLRVRLLFLIAHV